MTTIDHRRLSREVGTLSLHSQTIRFVSRHHVVENFLSRFVLHDQSHGGTLFCIPYIERYGSKALQTIAGVITVQIQLICIVQTIVLIILGTVVNVSHCIATGIQVVKRVCLDDRGQVRHRVNRILPPMTINYFLLIKNDL